MPSLTEHREFWADYKWPENGEEWSKVWGGAENQWWGTIFPRLRYLLPAASVLELAPGYGRFTEYLKEHCEHFVGVDFSERCVEACRERFADCPQLEFHVNDGLHLEMIEDASIDLVFSIDSLVHLEIDVVDSYLGEISRVLVPDGYAFLHHSNLKAVLDAGEDLSVKHRHWRGESVSAEVVRELCSRHGLGCRSQESVNWGGGGALLDCFSVISRSAAPETAVVENPDFMTEAILVGKAAAIYSGVSHPAK